MPAIALLWLLLLAPAVPTLGPGAQGSAVAALQTVLSAQGFASGPPDGHDGPRTTQAVSGFEQAAGLSVDGRAGPAVIRTLLDRYASAAPVLSQGASGSAVLDLQSLLTADGFRCSLDGRFGPATRSAVQDLQRSRGLSADGVVGPRTWQAVFSQNYTVAPGDTIDAIAARLSVPPDWIITANGGSQEIFSGRTLLIPFAGWSPAAAPASPAGTTGSGSSVTGGGGAASSGSSGNSASSAGSGSAGSSGFIPASALALWGGAGTPDIYLVALPTSADTLRAAQQAPAGISIALPAGLWSLAPAADRVILATSSLRDVERLHPRWVIWLGLLSASTERALLRSSTNVLIASVRTGNSADALARGASGGLPLVVELRAGQTSLIGDLARRLRAAGFRLLELGQY